MFKLYLALGDSMSIDYYPSQDAERAGIKVQDEIGAAALLHSNEASLFPEFNNKDLKTRCQEIHYKNLAFDGTTGEDMLNFGNLLREMDALSTLGSALITLTLGGNDLLQAYRRSQSGSPLFEQFEVVQTNYQKVLGLIRQKFPGSVLVLTTVYDPTDGTGVLPTAAPLYQDVLPIKFLEQFNTFVSDCANSHGALLADVHKHFLGHGATCGSIENFWYWKPSPIEPSYRGASEIRRVWLDTLEKNGHL